MGCFSTAEISDLFYISRIFQDTCTTYRTAHSLDILVNSFKGHIILFDKNAYKFNYYSARAWITPKISFIASSMSRITKASPNMIPQSVKARGAVPKATCRMGR